MARALPILLTLSAVFSAKIAQAQEKENVGFVADQKLLALDRAVSWNEARLIAVQDANRYKTLESLARETMAAMYGAENFPEMTPIGSYLEWAFNREAYVDRPVIRIKDVGIRGYFGAHFSEADRKRLHESGRLTLHELRDDPEIQQRISELDPRTTMAPAMNRVHRAQAAAIVPERALKIVPRPVEPPRVPDDTPLTLLKKRQAVPWATPEEIAPNLREALPDLAGRVQGQPAAGISGEEAVAVLKHWAALRQGWLERDAGRVNAALAGLVETLPQYALPDAYPARPQRSAEAFYYRMGKFAGWWALIYFAGLIVAIFALITRWTTPWVMMMALLAIGLGVHAWGLGLRWMILGRIPNANMFEAIMFSAAVVVLLAFVAELWMRARVFGLAAHATGFMALVVAGFVLPGGGTITSIMGILDDIMLRIHTVIIISSYGLVFLASIIAVVYLFGYYFALHRKTSAELGLATAVAGALLWLLAGRLFTSDPLLGAGQGALIAGTRPLAVGLLALAAMVITALLLRRAPGKFLAYGGLSVVALTPLLIGHQGFLEGLAMVLAIGGAAWAAATYLGGLWVEGLRKPALAAAIPGFGMVNSSELLSMRPILAGGAPGDEGRAAQVPAWLQTIDWCQLIFLNLVFIMLFIGTVLGAVWADYSWGRPWGWDPKEVFALNTWIIYAILIHVRFMVKQRGLWTAWLAVLGALMMVFNWCFVNFFIVGLHSYA